MTTTIKKELTGWLPQFDANKNFIEVTGWDAVIKQIFVVLITRKNTRQWQPDFGCNLIDILFDIGDKTDEAKDEIKEAMKWVPEVQLTDLEVTEENLSGRTGKKINVIMSLTYLKEKKKVKLIIPESIDLLRGSVFNVSIKEVEIK